MPISEIETAWREACFEYLFAVFNGFPDSIIKDRARHVLMTASMLDGSEFNTI